VRTPAAVSRDGALLSAPAGPALRVLPDRHGGAAPARRRGAAAGRRRMLPGSC